MSAMLSPLVYLRCSENSTENPWNGLACSPAMNPSTMNLARRSSRETWRITSGFRYFSAGPGQSGTPDRSGLEGGAGPPSGWQNEEGGPGPPYNSLDVDARLPAAAVVLGRLGLLHLHQQPLDDALGRLPLGLGLEVGADPMPQDGDGDLADVVERDA